MIRNKVRYNIVSTTYNGITSYIKDKYKLKNE